MSLSQWLDEDYETIDWKAVFTRPHITARDAKYFQYRIIHNILPVNFKLYIKWKLIDSAKCRFCRTEDETVYHLFAECVICKPFWKNFENFLERIRRMKLSLTPKIIILGDEENDLFVNYMLILAKI
jgi:hypothetical protein